MLMRWVAMVVMVFSGGRIHMAAVRIGFAGVSAGCCSN